MCKPPGGSAGAVAGGSTRPGTHMGSCMCFGALGFGGGGRCRADRCERPENPCPTDALPMYAWRCASQGAVDGGRKLRWSPEADDLVRRVSPRDERRVVREVEDSVRDSRGAEVGLVVLACCVVHITKRAATGPCGSLEPFRRPVASLAERSRPCSRRERDGCLSRLFLRRHRRAYCGFPHLG